MLTKSQKPSAQHALGLKTLEQFLDHIHLAAYIITSPVHHIITLSIMQSKFPYGWKYSKDIPLHKKGSTLDKENYRPVAILSPLSKVIEKLVYKQIYEFFTRNKILHEDLHGFRQNRSTLTALLTMYDRWVQAASSSQFSGVVLIDLSAAFDLVDHRLLLEKLKIYGLQDDYLKWIESYLCGRVQAVWIDNILSDFLPCEAGVPQGSILGPLLFLIFFNDLACNVKSSIDAYADDTTVSAAGQTVEQVESQLTKDCQQISTWMQSNKLKMNPQKTQLMAMGTQKRLGNVRPLKVIVDNVTIQEDRDKCQTLLGCNIFSNMKWDHHVNTLEKKLAARLNGLRQIRFACPYPLRKQFVEGLFNSVLVYCLPVFGGLEVSQLNRLQILQNKAARLVLHAPPRAKRKSLTKNQRIWPIFCVLKVEIIEL